MELEEGRMKKSIVLVLVLAMMLTLAACGGDKTPPAAPPGDGTPAGTPGDVKVADTFFNMFSGGTYHMKSKVVAEGMEVTTEQFFKNGMVASMMEVDGNAVRTVIRDDKMHMIYDTEKMVMIMAVPAQLSSGEAAAMETDGMSYSGSGTAEFSGKTLPYDEYNITGGGKTQFFVDGNKLAGMRTISAGQEVDVVILELNQTVPDSVFEIPADYQEMSVMVPTTAG
jgi:predicted small lipoprotein YifL